MTNTIDEFRLEQEVFRIQQAEFRRKQERFIIASYKEGYPTKEITKLVRLSSATVCKIIKQNGLTRKKDHRKRDAKIMQLYKSNKSTKEIARALHISQKTCLGVLKSAGVWKPWWVEIEEEPSGCIDVGFSRLLPEQALELARIMTGKRLSGNA